MPGMYFEEFNEGVEIVSPGRTVTEADVVMFAALSGDYNQMHTDAEFAKGSVFGERVAHGLLGLSIASGLAWRTGFIEGTVEAFTALDWKFRAPIKLGDTIHTRIKVARTKRVPRTGGGIVIFDMVVKNQRDETVQKGQWTLLIKSKDEGNG
jgi:3-hydroxybutyryl-CoA dehydratase